jgi:hypothetical protein
MEKIKDKEEVLGFNSRCEDGKHIIIWDYDAVEYKDIISSLNYIQENYRLGNIYIFKTFNGYNAVSLSKLYFEEVYKLKKNTRYSDYQHNEMGHKLGKWVMRVGEDKYIIKTLGNNIVSDNELSNAHKIFLEKIFNVKINESGKFDNLSKMEIETYWRNK